MMRRLEKLVMPHDSGSYDDMTWSLYTIQDFIWHLGHFGLASGEDYTRAKLFKNEAERFLYMKRKGKRI